MESGLKAKIGDGYTYIVTPWFDTRDWKLGKPILTEIRQYDDKYGKGKYRVLWKRKE